MKNLFAHKYILFITLGLLLLLPVYCLFLLRTNSHALVKNIEFDYIFFFICGLLFSFIGSKIISYNERIKTYGYFLFAGALICYTIFLFATTLFRYTHFLSESVDVTYYHSAVLQLSKFTIPYIWDVPVPIWSQHFEPILFFIIPLYWIIQSAGVLVSIQALVILSGIIPLYVIGRYLFHSRFIGLAFGYAYISFGAMLYGMEYGFHPIMFFPTFFFWTYYWYISKKNRLYFLFILLSLFIKEEVSFILLFFGIYQLITNKDKSFGVWTSVMSLGWYGLCFHVIIPHFNLGKDFIYWGQYAQTGGTGISGIVQTLFMKPQQFFSSLITPVYKIDTLFLSLGTFSWLPVFYPPVLLLIIPSLMEKLLSNGVAGVSGTHYSAALTGCVVIASIETIRFYAKRVLINRYVKNWRIFVGLMISYVAFFANSIHGYYPYSVYDIGKQQRLPEENISLLNKIVTKIPKEASVATQYQIVPHMYVAGKVHNGPLQNESADFVIVNLLLKPVLTDKNLLEKNIESVSNNSMYELMLNQSNIVVFMKKSFSIDTLNK
jgi:uncharacterized membrane protein